MMENGHARDAVLAYELPFIYAFAGKRVEAMRAESPPQQPEERTFGGGRRSGQMRTVKTMTSDQALAKVRNQKKGG